MQGWRGPRQGTEKKAHFNAMVFDHIWSTFLISLVWHLKNWPKSTHSEKGNNQGFSYYKFLAFFRTCIFSTLWKLNPSKVSKSKHSKGLALLKAAWRTPNVLWHWLLPSHFALPCTAESSHCPSSRIHDATPKLPATFSVLCENDPTAKALRWGTASWLPLVSLSHPSPEWIKASTKVESI